MNGTPGDTDREAADDCQTLSGAKILDESQPAPCFQKHDFKTYFSAL